MEYRFETPQAITNQSPEKIQYTRQQTVQVAEPSTTDQIEYLQISEEAKQLQSDSEISSTKIYFPGFLMLAPLTFMRQYQEQTWDYNK